HTRFSRDWSSDVCSSDLRLGHPELLKEMDVLHFFDALGIVLCGSADRIQIYGAVLLERLARPLAHAAFADDGTNAKLANDVGLRSEERREGKSVKLERRR